jgi:hypothetical protein
MIYLLDADALIQAANVYYSFKAWPGFWKWIEQKHAEGVFFSLEKVHEEIAGD